MVRHHSTTSTPHFRFLLPERLRQLMNRNDCTRHPQMYSACPLEIGFPGNLQTTYVRDTTVIFQMDEYAKSFRFSPRRLTFEFTGVVTFAAIVGDSGVSVEWLLVAVLGRCVCGRVP